jgi:hypothetical protein
MKGVFEFGLGSVTLSEFYIHLDMMDVLQIKTGCAQDRNHGGKETFTIDIH